MSISGSVLTKGANRNDANSYKMDSLSFVIVELQAAMKRLKNVFEAPERVREAQDIEDV